MYDANKVEKEVLEFWKSKDIYKKTRDKNKDNKPFYFLQGPPYTSGKLHIAHAWNNSMKDMVLRYKNMKGFHVWDRAGYDMHGLPTASKVQEKLGLKSKEDILGYGLDKFTKDNETVIVPGKVLGIGDLNHKITIAAWQFSTKAKEKIDNKLSIQQLLEKNPQGKGIKIIG